jgi:UDP-N-acetylglucosamine/UDP-N-acetylgalactosamine diphosphorylase
MDIDADLEAQLRDAGQDHLIECMNDALLEQISTIDFDELRVLTEAARKSTPAPPASIAPMPVEDWSAIQSSAAAGEAAFRAGAVAVLIVAGGQGTRLGFDKPKGLFPVSPVRGASLFQIHAEKVLAAQAKFGARIALLIMTSAATHDATIAFFEENRFFGLNEDLVFFFEQGTMPAVDIATGRVLLESADSIARSPNGHGGALTALADSGLLNALRKGGMEHLVYLQVDNPLVRIADTAFLGRHIELKSQASTKVVFKESPDEKVGVLAMVDDRCGIIEYSDLPRELAVQQAADGSLAYKAGNTAIHLFDLDFIDTITAGETRLPFHTARKKVPHYDPASGVMVTPTTENAFKFEHFIFDALPMAKQTLAVSVQREDEFAPLKNATGSDSLATVQAAMIAQARQWLEAAGATVADGVPVEVSPLVATGAEELTAVVKPGVKLDQPTCIEATAAAQEGRFVS